MSPVALSWSGAQGCSGACAVGDAEPGRRQPTALITTFTADFGRVS